MNTYDRNGSQVVCTTTREDWQRQQTDVPDVQFVGFEPNTAGEWL